MHDNLAQINELRAEMLDITQEVIDVAAVIGDTQNAPILQGGAAKLRANDAVAAVDLYKLTSGLHDIVSQYYTYIDDNRKPGVVDASTILYVSLKVLLKRIRQLLIRISRTRGANAGLKNPSNTQSEGTY